MKKNPVGGEFDCEHTFHPTFSGSSNTITIKKSYTSNWNELEQQLRRFWPSIYITKQNGEEYEDVPKEVEDSGKSKEAYQKKYTKETEKKKGWGNLSTLAF